MIQNKKGGGVILAIGFFLLLLLMIMTIIFFIGYGLGYAFTIGYDTITIKEKWVKYHGEDAKYLISSMEGEVYQITDTLWKWRWDSSDLYASLEEDMTCDIKYQGWRFPFFSDYKNILEADCR